MYSKILVPVAPDHGSEGRRSMEVARKLLQAGGRITVLTVIEAVPSYVAQYLPEDRQETNRTEIEAELASRFGAADVAVAARIGHPSRMILDMAEADGYDCIIIDSHRPGLQDYFLGSTAARVVRHAQCGVHVLR
ncbi:MAG: universal stress protein [Gemmobacter sp.]